MPAGDSIEGRLAELGLALPPPPKPIGRFAYAAEAAGLLFVSGTYGTVAGQDGLDRLPRRGKLGRELSVEEGYESARQVALNLLAMARAHLGTLDLVDRPLRLAGYVNAVAGFDRAPEVLNGASDLLLAAFGPERGAHARIALYQQDLAGDAPVTAELILALTAPP
jgi:enamine deaminase RidA (YjgF/YER057c/UK114 family)